MDNLKTNIQANRTVILALIAVYVIWGSTYLAIRFALVGLPPFLMAGTRFVIAGSLLFGFMRWRGAPMPTRREWVGSIIVGGLLLAGGNGVVAFAEQWVPSGLAAVWVATTPVWAALFGGLWGKWPGRVEWVGLVLGFVGVVILNFEGNLLANPIGAIALTIATISWAFGSVWSRHLSLPAGPMASGTEMLAGGTFLLCMGLVSGERVTAWPPVSSLVAVLYLIVFGSLIAYSSYAYLLRKVRPSLATSYAYVNPMVAVLLGVVLGGEKISGVGVVAMLTILGGVVLVTLGNTGQISKAN